MTANSGIKETKEALECAIEEIHALDDQNIILSRALNFIMRHQMLVCDGHVDNSSVYKIASDALDNVKD